MPVPQIVRELTVVVDEELQLSLTPPPGVVHTPRAHRADVLAAPLDAIEDRHDIAGQTSMVQSAAVSNGTVVAVGAVQSLGEDGTISWGSSGAKSPRVSGRSELAFWTSSDGMTWQRVVLTDPLPDQLQFAGSIAGGPGGFVTITRVIRERPSLRSVQVTMTSADGETWTANEASPPGGRFAIASIRSGWVTVGSATEYPIELPGTEAAIPPVIDGASVWISRG